MILKDAPILILDEATSALDSEVEAAIQDTLYGVMQGKTVIAIAHRLSTIARMDRIVVLDDGAIAEEGTHAELLATGGLYARFWKRQSGGFIDCSRGRRGRRIDGEDPDVAQLARRPPAARHAAARPLKRPTALSPAAGQGRAEPMRPPCSTASPRPFRCRSIPRPRSRRTGSRRPATARLLRATSCEQFRGALDRALRARRARLGRRRDAADLRRLDRRHALDHAARARSSPSTGATLALMLAVVLLRPVFFVADALVRNHAITPNLVDLVRWQSHWHVIRQSWTFFQNDFAGRIGNKVLQAGEAIEMTVNLTIDAVWYAAVFVAVAIVVLAGMDPLLLVPIAVWLVAYALLFRWTMPRVDAELRGGLRGALGDDRAHGRQLHQHPDAEDLRRRRRRGRLCRRVGRRRTSAPSAG